MPFLFILFKNKAPLNSTIAVSSKIHRLPDAPPKFEYTEIGVVGVDGFVDSKIRRAQDMFVRLKPVEAPNKACAL